MLKIACKQLDPSLLMNSVSLLIKVGDLWGGVYWAWGGPVSSYRASQHPKTPPNQWKRVAGDSRGRGALKNLATELCTSSFVRLYLTFRSPMCVFNLHYLICASVFSQHFSLRSTVQRFRIASPALAQNALAFSIRIPLYNSPQRTTFELMKISAAR